MLIQAANFTPQTASMQLPVPFENPAHRLLRKLSSGQVASLTRTLDRVARGETREANLTWIDFSISIRYVGGRLILSLFSHNQAGSVVGYVVEEVIDGESQAFLFGNRHWAVAE